MKHNVRTMCVTVGACLLLVCSGVSAAPAKQSAALPVQEGITEETNAQYIAQYGKSS